MPSAIQVQVCLDRPGHQDGHGVHHIRADETGTTQECVGTHILATVSSRSQEDPKMEMILGNQITFQSCITKFNISHIRRLWLNLISFLISPHITR